MSTENQPHFKMPGKFYRYLFGGMLALAMAALAACHDPGGGGLRSTSSTQEPNLELFHNASRMLYDLDAFDGSSALKTIVERLNQWIAVEPAEKPAAPEALFDTLPKPLREQFAARLGGTEFDETDGQFLAESIWLRDVSNSAGHGTLDDVKLASALFDWTIRNIQLDPNPSPASKNAAPPLTHLPWETLLYGHGTAVERAWLFVLLARQQGLDAVLLAKSDSAEDQARPLAAALLVKDELYLFDTRLGLPIGADGQPATLNKLAADDGLLRELDLDDKHPYLLTAADLSSVVALIEGSPGFLEQRMATVEAELGGPRKPILSINASSIAERVGKCQHISAAKLWSLPYERLQQRAARGETALAEATAEFLPYAGGTQLWRGRLLQFRGIYDAASSGRGGSVQEARNEFGAKHYFLQSRPPATEIDSAQPSPQQREIAGLIKQNATYWLGLVMYEQHEYDASEDWLLEHTLKAWPDGTWTNGAHFNLGQAYEAANQTDKAIQQYLADEGPQRDGDQLRARWLRHHAAQKPDAK